jgi:hypothetical protein
MRLTRTLAVLAATGLLAAGCTPPFGGSGHGGLVNAGQQSTLGPGRSWIVATAGTPTPPATPRTGGSPSATPLPTISAAPGASTCAFAWRAGQVMIPVTAVPGAGSFQLSWPRVGEPPPTTYRVAAVPQDLVSGQQPDPQWQTVSAPSGCSATATISALTAGRPYVVWLDAPDSGYQIDGTPWPKSGRTDVVYPG